MCKLSRRAAGLVQKNLITKAFSCQLLPLKWIPKLQNGLSFFFFLHNICMSLRGFCSNSHRKLWSRWQKKQTGWSVWCVYGDFFWGGGGTSLNLIPWDTRTSCLYDLNRPSSITPNCILDAWCSNVREQHPHNVSEKKTFFSCGFWCGNTTEVTAQE